MPSPSLWREGKGLCVSPPPPLRPIPSTCSHLRVRFGLQAMNPALKVPEVLRSPPSHCISWDRRLSGGAPCPPKPTVMSL